MSNKLKQLNKETISRTLMDNFNFSQDLSFEIIEVIWQSEGGIHQTDSQALKLLRKIKEKILTDPDWDADVIVSEIDAVQGD